ncbi:tetratricopeptide repeat protein [bacterium]|nr:tetratricopeptide repeat protein [bacterium]
MAEAPEALIQQAQSSLAVGDTASAQSALNQLLQQYPGHPQGLLRRGFVRVRAGDVDGAIDDWEQAVEADPGLLRQLDSAEFRPIVETSLQSIKYNISAEPTNIRYQVQLGKAYAAFGRYAQALQAFTSALRLAPEEMEAGLGSAQVYMRLGQGEQALQVLQKVYELHPDNVDLCWRLGKLYNSLNSVVQATRFFERASTLDPNDWKSHLELGQIFMRQGRHEQATARFQTTQQIKPDCAAALVGMAECCKELYRFEQAISYYRQAVALDPRDYKALCQMGSLCIQLGGLDMGIETLLQALDLNENDVEIHSSLAKAYQQKGDLPTAARYFAKTVEFNSKDYFAAYNLGLIYRSQGQIKEAAEAFGTAAQLRPNDSQYQYQSSRALLELGQVEQALEAARKAVNINPHSKESQLLYGRCCLEAERYDMAAEAFRQAVQIDAQNVEAHYQLAVALLNLGQTEEARNSFHTVLRLSPQHAPSQLGLGHVARRTGQWQTAADHYRQAIQLDLTLKPAIIELTKLYLERNQKDSINEFVRQVCLSRKGDHRIPADFLKDWLEALESNKQHALAEEALEFVLNIYPTSPQAKENHRTFHLRSARYFLDKNQPDTARIHIDQLRKLHPREPALAELQQALNSGQPAGSPGPAKNFESLDDPLWAPLDMEPKKRGQIPSGGEKKPTSSLLPPPPIDDFGDQDLLFSEPTSSLTCMGGLAPPPALAADGLGPQAQDLPPIASEPVPTSMLLPPPLEDFADTETTLDDPWESTHISRLALEDVSAGLNPSENLTALAQHYLDFALHLEERGWLKQASLFLTDARNFRPNDPSLVEHQVRVLESWADRLERDNDGDGAGQLRSWLEPLQRSAPPRPDIHPPQTLPEPATVDVAPVPPIEESGPGPSFDFDEPVAVSEEAISEDLTGMAEAEAVTVETENTPPAPTQEVEIDGSSFQKPPVAPPPPVTEPEPEDSRTQITDWMMSFQEPPAPEPEPEPVPPPVEEAQPYRSAEFEISLSGEESVEELVQMIARYPDDEKIRAAILRAFADDVPGLLKVFRELSLEAPEEPYHVLNLARAYAHSGSDSLAVLQYRKYVKMEATSEGYRELGQIYERMGKVDLAAQALSRSEQLSKREAE